VYHIIAVIIPEMESIKLTHCKPGLGQGHKGEKLIIFPHQEAKVPMQKIVNSPYALPKKLE